MLYNIRNAIKIPAAYTEPENLIRGLEVFRKEILCTFLLNPVIQIFGEKVIITFNFFLLHISFSERNFVLLKSLYLHILDSLKLYNISVAN